MIAMCNLAAHKWGSAQKSAEFAIFHLTKSSRCGIMLSKFGNVGRRGGR